MENTIDKDKLKDVIEKVLSSLKKREGEVIRLYYGIGHEKSYTLKQIGEMLSLTRERIRQIKKKALARMHIYTRKEPLEPFVNINFDLERPYYEECYAENMNIINKDRICPACDGLFIPLEKEVDQRRKNFCSVKCYNAWWFLNSRGIKWHRRGYWMRKIRKNNGTVVY